MASSRSLSDSFLDSHINMITHQSAMIFHKVFCEYGGEWILPSFNQIQGIMSYPFGELKSLLHDSK